MPAVASSTMDVDPRAPPFNDDETGANELNNADAAAPAPPTTRRPDVHVLLFDLDDTLWDCASTLTRARQRFHAEYPQVADKDVRTYFGKLREEFPERAFDYTFQRRTFLERENPVGTSEEEIDRQLARFLELRSCPVWLDGVREALVELGKRRWEPELELEQYVAVSNGNEEAAVVQGKEEERRQEGNGRPGRPRRYVIGTVTDGNTELKYIPELRDLVHFHVNAVDAGAEIRVR